MNTKGDITVANFNVHAGIDGWGRRYDAVSACCALDADLLVIEEDWVGDDPEESIGANVAVAGGYQIITAPSARARRILPPPMTSNLPRSWAPRRNSHRSRPIRLEASSHAMHSRDTTVRHKMPSTTGEWATSLLSRVPFLHHAFIELPMLRADVARRSAIVATLDLARSEPVTVIAVHLGHLSHGSPRQMRVLRACSVNQAGLVIVVGDLNCWGPPLRVFLRGLHDCVSGPTWPAWRPHSRIDHILTNRPDLVATSAVLPNAGSDHRPITASFTVSAS